MRWHVAFRAKVNVNHEAASDREKTRPKWRMLQRNLQEADYVAGKISWTWRLAVSLFIVIVVFFAPMILTFKDVKIATRLNTSRRITFMEEINDEYEQSCFVDDAQLPLSFGTHT